MGRPEFAGSRTQSRKRCSHAANASCSSTSVRPSNVANRSSNSGIATGAASRSLLESGS